MPRFIEKATKAPAAASFLMGTDANGIDGKYSQEALKDFFTEAEAAAREEADTALGERITALGEQGIQGEKGDAGRGIKSCVLNAQNHLIITYDDDAQKDAGEVLDISQVAQNASDIAALQSGKQDKLTVTAGAWTNNSTYVKSGSFSWRKYGRLVIVAVKAVKLASWTDGDKFLSTNAGPKPMVHSYGSIGPLNGTGSPQLFAIATDGKIMANGGISHEGEFYGSFSYIAAE